MNLNTNSILGLTLKKIIFLQDFIKIIEGKH